MLSIKQAVILCGGLGTRLLPLTKNMPKPMVRVNGKPFILHIIQQCKANGIFNILLLCGYKYENIKNFFQDGRKFGVKISYHYNSPKIQTYKRIYEARKFLKTNFLLLYSDNYSSLNIKDLINNHNKFGSKLTLSISKKIPGNIDINKNSGIIQNYSFNRSNKKKFVEIGYMIVNKKKLLSFYRNKNLSFSYFIKYMTDKKEAFYYHNDTGYLSISDLKRLKLTRKIFKRRIILIDRDGVLNKKNPNHFYVRNIKELNLNISFIKKYKKLLKNVNLICITNQAGISTGDLSERNLKDINNYLKVKLKKLGISIKKFLISKHHYNSNNFDRKPNHGLFLKASREFEFVLDKTFYIGDDIRDIEASYRAKTKCLYVGRKKLSYKLKKKYMFTLISKNINERR